jgi:undecaprenyl diphosphate synthase
MGCPPRSMTSDNPPSIKHIALIMDGNGRWAKNHFLPRFMGHRRGARNLHKVVLECLKENIAYLTVFAFSSENWRRPPEEVSFLMNLFIVVLRREITQMHALNIRLKIIGDRSSFPKNLIEAIHEAEVMTANNTGLVLTVAANYGGRWDVLQASKRLIQEAPEKKGQYTEQDLQAYLSTADLPDPDLLIRTGGESRISNFLNWQCANSRLIFTNTLWPDFNARALRASIQSFYRN